MLSYLLSIPVNLKQLDENVLYTTEYAIRTYNEAGKKAEERVRNEESAPVRPTATYDLITISFLCCLVF